MGAIQAHKADKVTETGNRKRYCKSYDHRPWAAIELGDRQNDDEYGCVFRQIAVPPGLSFKMTVVCITDTYTGLAAVHADAQHEHLLQDNQKCAKCGCDDWEGHIDPRFCLYQTMAVHFCDVMQKYCNLIVRLCTSMFVYMDHQLDWEALKTFKEVAQLRTVRAAAKSLGVHHSTVSRRIEQLETDAGVRLFDRRPEGYMLTAPGEDLLAVTSGFSEDLLTVSRQIAGLDDELTGSVTLTLPEPIAETAFAPRLNEFVETYPGLELNLLTSLELLDVARREADIAIRMDNNPPLGLVGKKLYTYKETVYASPYYLERLDLRKHPERARWLRWDKDDGEHPDWALETDFAAAKAWGHFPSLRMQIASARHGFGLAMLPCLMGDNDPELVRATNRPPRDARDVWILTHNDLRHTARIRAVMEFAERVMRDMRHELVGEGLSED